MKNDERKFEFEKLEVYQKTLVFIDQVYVFADRLPGSERFGLCDQFKRASVSVALNIAEGAGRFNRREKSQFYRMAKASVNECVAILQISNRRGFLNDDDFEKLYDRCWELARMLGGLIGSQRT